MTGSSRQPADDALADASAIRAGDRYGLLPALATAGAQVRAVAEQLTGASFDRPRSLIVVDTAHTGDGELAAALLAQPRVPVVAGAGLPPWAGPLDLAVVLAAAPDDLLAARAAADATRRGVTVVVRAAANGPVADAAGAALIAPRIAVPELAAGPGRLALLFAVACAAGVAAGSDGAGAALNGAADALDAEALVCGPGAEPFVNPAVALALRLADGCGLFVGEDRWGAALAARCARSMRLLGGRVAAAQHAAGLLPGGQLVAALSRPGDPFADPDLDGTDGTPVTAVLLPTRPGGHVPGGAIAALLRSLPRAVLLGPDEEDADPLTAALTVALRTDFAAAYVGITAGQVPPADGPSGLGPSGGHREVRPATTVDDVRTGDGGGGTWS